MTLALHWHCPVFWSQLGAPAEVLIVPTSLQLQRMQPFGFEALRPDQPGKQFSHWRPVTATLHWHWPPTWRWETRTKKDKTGVMKLEPPKRATPNLQWTGTGRTWAHMRLLLTVPAILQSHGWHTLGEVGSNPSNLKNPLMHSSQFLPDRRKWQKQGWFKLRLRIFVN